MRVVVAVAVSGGSLVTPLSSLSSLSVAPLSTPSSPVLGSSSSSASNPIKAPINVLSEPLHHDAVIVGSGIEGQPPPSWQQLERFGQLDHQQRAVALGPIAPGGPMMMTNLFVPAPLRCCW
jgi:hypothetical protein